MPVGRGGNRLEHPSAGLGKTRRIEHQLAPAARFGVIGKHVDQGLGDPLSTMVVVDVKVIHLAGPHAGYRFGQVIEDEEAHQLVVKPRPEEFAGAVLQQMFGIIFVGLAWRAPFERLCISGDQWRQRMGVLEAQLLNLNIGRARHHQIPVVMQGATFPIGRRPAPCLSERRQRRQCNWLGLAGERPVCIAMRGRIDLPCNNGRCFFLIDILLTILPVFLVLGAGYASVRFGYLDASIADALNAFAVRLAVPLLLFAAMLRLDFGAAFHPPMLVGFYAGAFTCFVLAIALARLVWHRRPGEAVSVGFSATFSNTLLLGLPIIKQAYGEAAASPAFAIISLHAPLIYSVGIVTMELSRRDGRPLAETLLVALKSVLGNSLMIGILGGIAFNLAGIGLPDAVMAGIDLLAAAAIPAALVGIGASLTQYKLTAGMAESLAVSALALLLHPLIALMLTHYVFALPLEFVRTAVVLAAMPPGVNIYIFATMYDRGVQLAASLLLLSTALSVITISGWLYVVSVL